MENGIRKTKGRRPARVLGEDASGLSYPGGFAVAEDVASRSPYCDR
jgi:hypothetical protein